MSFDPDKMPPAGRPCAVVDSMARDLAAGATRLQEVLLTIRDGRYMEARDWLPDVPNLRPARQYLLGLADAQDGGAT